MTAKQTLTQLLTEQLRLLKEFLDATAAQTALIEGEDIAALNTNLELRARLIEKIDRLRPQLALQKDEENGPAVTDLQEEIGMVLREITEINHRSQAAVRERMALLQAEIRRLDDTRKGLGAYIKGTEIFVAEYFDERQ